MKPTDVRKHNKFRFMPWNHARTTYQYWLCHHIHTVDKRGNEPGMKENTTEEYCVRGRRAGHTAAMSLSLRIADTLLSPFHHSLMSPTE